MKQEDAPPGGFLAAYRGVAVSKETSPYGSGVYTLGTNIADALEAATARFVDPNATYIDDGQTRKVIDRLAQLAYTAGLESPTFVEFVRAQQGTNAVRAGYYKLTKDLGRIWSASRDAAAAQRVDAPVAESGKSAPDSHCGVGRDKLRRIAMALRDKGGYWGTFRLIEHLMGWLAHGGRCVYCGAELVNDEGTHIIEGRAVTDHLLPQGKYPEIANADYLNAVPACAGCNSLKGPWDPNKEEPLYEGKRSADVRDAERANRAGQATHRRQKGKTQGVEPKRPKELGGCTAGARRDCLSTVRAGTSRPTSPLKPGAETDSRFTWPQDHKSANQSRGMLVHQLQDRLGERPARIGWESD